MKIEAPKAWGAAEEISGAKIPGMPESKRGVAKRAIKEGWKHRPRIGHRGGGIEFSVIDFASDRCATRSIGGILLANGIKIVGRGDDQARMRQRNPPR